MRHLLIILSALLFVIAAKGQSHWSYLPNTGFSKGFSIADTSYRVEDIYFTDTLTGYAITLRNRLLKTMDGGNSWTVKNDTVGILCQFRSIEFLDDSLTGFAGSLAIPPFLAARIMMTTDSGNTWADITPKIPDPSPTSPHSICGMGHFKNNVYGVGFWGSDTARFYKSTDKGNTWTCKLLDTSVLHNAIDVVFISADTGFIGGGTGKHAIVAKTTNGGITWKRVFADSIIGGRIWKLQHVSGNVIVGAIEGRFSPDTACMIYSKDRGNTWQILSAGSRPPITAGVRGTQGVGFATPALGWLGGYYDGVFETVDSGNTWNHIPFGYDFNRIFVIDSGHVYAGGHMPYKYTFVIPPDTTDPIDTTTYIRKGASNFQNKLYAVSPNPSKGMVKIEFELKMPSNVLLEVINPTSKTIYRVINTPLNAGKHTYYWDGSNAPAGQYLVWFDNNEMPQSCKFILLK